MYMDWDNRVLTITENIKNDADWKLFARKYEEEFNLAKEIRLPYDIKRIYDCAFKDCFYLEKIVLPNGVSCIGSEAFNNCRNLKSVELPESLITINSMAFHNCKSLKEINFPDGLQTIDLGAFGGCVGLEKVDLPDSLEYVGRYAFKYCENLKEINIPSKIQHIKAGTFACCTALETVTMPKTRLIIEANAFCSVDKIEDIYIAKSSVILKEAFRNSEALTVHIGDKAVPSSYFNFSYVGDFFQDPSYEKMLKIQLMPIRINISMMYIDEDKRYETYLKKNISKVINYIANEERIDFLDILIDRKLISNKTIDKCLECVESYDFHEAFIMLTQYKNETGGYKETNQERFEL